MNERHRQQQFPSPFDIPELELDPEKELWVPGRKKIFIPSAPKPVVGFDWGELIRPLTAEMLDFRSLYLNRPLVDRPSSNARILGIGVSCDDCIPSRGIYTCDMRGRCTEPGEHERQQQIRTYNDIRRSEVPMFRSRRERILNDRYS
jgi:hypothetical protein